MTHTDLAVTTSQTTQALLENSQSHSVVSELQKSHQLPDEISSWADLLQAFLADLRAPLEQMGNVLSHVIKVLPLQEMAGKNEPDGIDGIHSIVNYERLLMSEWAIYHDFPEEFIRRAAFKEHQFYKLAHRERTNDEVVYVLLDCGPEQLGRPRVVQLAALILLLRSTESMGAKLHWGVIQDTKQQWFEGITPKLIENWLLMCSADLLDKDLLQQRLDNLDQSHLENGRVWCVTPEPLDNFKQLMQVDIQGNISTSVDEQREITVKAGRANRQQIQTLVLPEDNICNQLLSDPFQKAIQQPDTSKSWVLSQSGAFIVQFNASRYLKSYKMKARNPSIQLSISPQATILGIFVNKRNTFVLSATNDEYLLQGFPASFKHKSYKKSHNIQVTDTLPRMVVLTQSSRVLLLDAKHNLRCLSFNEDHCHVETVANSVYAFGYNGNFFYYVAFDAKQRELSLHWASEHQTNYQRMSKVTLQTNVQRSVPEVYIDPKNWNLSDGGRVAFRESETQWKVKYAGVEELVSIVIPPELIVIGFQQLNDPKTVVQESGLVCPNSNNNKTISMIASDSNEIIHFLPEACAYVEINPNKPLLHYQTQHGLLKTIEIASGREVSSRDLNA